MINLNEQIEFIKEYIDMDFDSPAQLEKWEAILESLYRLKNLEK